MNTKILRAGCAFTALLAVSACGEKVASPNTQYGAHPVLPAPQQYLVPPMQVPTAEGWHEGETPKVPSGLKVQAFATGFKHPRMVYTLPNGDVLVVESNGPNAPVYRPKDYIESKIKALAGSDAPGGNRITLLRDLNGDGAPKVRTVFLDHLNSPFGT